MTEVKKTLTAGHLAAGLRRPRRGRGVPEAKEVAVIVAVGVEEEIVVEDVVVKMLTAGHLAAGL